MIRMVGRGEKSMKKWITVDAFICAFLSAIAAGLGYSIPAALGAPSWLCMVISMAFESVAEEVANKIMYTRYVQEKPVRKFRVFLSFLFVFLIGHLISVKVFGDSLFESLEEEFMYVLLFAGIGFVKSLCGYCFRYVKVKGRYGRGEEGFRFTKEDTEYVRSLNQQNKEITGAYDASLAARTKNGIFVGKKGEGAISFCGIPYAKAPVGELRWKAPCRLPESGKVYEAFHYGPSSVQVNYEGNPLRYHRQSEDCLYLNVHTADFSAKKPVAVFFHGGDFTFGGSASPLWDMSNFVKAHPDVVAVSFNYRLGLLGAIDFSDVPGGENCPDAGALCLLDQMAALEWVKENIASFGGDPERITVLGAGAGGVSIGLLASCAGQWFGNAVVFSGNPEITEACGAEAKKLAAALLKEASASCMEDLLKLSQGEIARLTQSLKGYLTVPKADGRRIPGNVIKEYRTGAAKDIRFILCASKDSANSYGSSVGRGFSEKVVSAMIEKIMKELSPEAAEILRRMIEDRTERIGKAKAEAEFVNLWLDHAGLVRMSENLTAGGSKVHALYWNVDPVINNLGAGDVNMVSTVLGNIEAAQAYGSVVSDSIQSILQTLIVKFIRGEEPDLFNNEIDGVGAVRWDVSPDILEVTDDKVVLKPVGDTLKEAKEMLEEAEKDGEPMSALWYSYNAGRPAEQQKQTLET